MCEEEKRSNLTPVVQIVDMKVTYCFYLYMHFQDGTTVNNFSAVFWNNFNERFCIIVVTDCLCIQLPRHVYLSRRYPHRKVMSRLILETCTPSAGRHSR